MDRNTFARELLSRIASGQPVTTADLFQARTLGISTTLLSGYMAGKVTKDAIMYDLRTYINIPAPTVSPPSPTVPTVRPPTPSPTGPQVTPWTGPGARPPPPPSGPLPAAPPVPGLPGPLLVGGGQEQAQQALDAARLAIEARDAQQRNIISQRDIQARMELGRLGIGQGLLEHLTSVQRDPFSIVPALQMYGTAGGGTLAPAAALAASGGRGLPSPYGNVYEELLRRLSGGVMTNEPIGAGIEAAIGGSAPVPGASPGAAPASAGVRARTPPVGPAP